MIYKADKEFRLVIFTIIGSVLLYVAGLVMIVGGIGYLVKSGYEFELKRAACTEQGGLYLNGKCQSAVDIIKKEP